MIKDGKIMETKKSFDFAIEGNDLFFFDMSIVVGIYHF